jgi:hypothetical protein
MGIAGADGKPRKKPGDETDPKKYSHCRAFGLHRSTRRRGTQKAPTDEVSALCRSIPRQLGSAKATS